MIQSERELETVKQQIESLRQARDRVFERNEGTPFMMHLSASSFEKKMWQLWDEVDEYEIRTGRRAADQQRDRVLPAPRLAQTGPALPDTVPLNPQG